MLSKKTVKQSKSLPFWAWNDKLEKEKLLAQIKWMKEKGFGGFFMHARGGLETEYLGKEWFDSINVCIEKATDLGLQAWVYDENGWPSGFVGGKLLEDEANREWYLTFSIGQKDEVALVSYDISGEKLKRLAKNEICEHALNVYKRISVSTVDISDGEVVDKFIALTHERYRRETGGDFKNLSGFFTDEPQLYRMATPFPHKIGELFKKEYDVDILEELGLLFVEKAAFRTFRYRYWKACQKLLLENFAQKIFYWCDNNDMLLTGHYVEERDLYSQMLFNCGLMPFYEYEHIPGIDCLCRRFMSVVPARQVGSVAVQLGKREVVTETFAMTGWDVTPVELKAIAEFQYLYGPNKICQHLLPYSERAERKQDYPAHFTPLNPWIEQGMCAFNEYFDWLGGILQESEELVRVAVLHPVRSAYFHYQQGNAESTAELDGALLSLCNELAENQIAFHFLDETLLAKYGFVQNGKIGCGKVAYEYLVIPKCYTMDKSTERLIRAFVESGGRVYLCEAPPMYLEGEPFAYDYLRSNVGFEDLKNVQPYALTYQGGLIHSVYRKSKKGDFIILLNISDSECATGVLRVQGKMSLGEYCFSEDKTYVFGGEFTLEPCESKIIFVDQAEQERVDKLMVAFDKGKFEVKERDENALLLDFVKYSLDGKNYSEKYPLSAIFQHLLENRYEGELWLAFPFEILEKPDFIRVEMEYGTQTEIFVNGKQMQGENIAPLLCVGENEVTLKLHFYENENVWLALFGEGVTETLKNCLVYDTYLDNIYLRGDFGVYAKGGFTSGNEKNTLLADAFYIGKRKVYVEELVQSGEPFFSGRIVLKKKLFLTDKNVCLQLYGRIHFARIFVNGNNAGECLFNSLVDISDFAKVGENDIEIELYTSARNKLGPHHEKWWEENLMVTPSSFSLLEFWHDFKCEHFRNEYSFVKAGILQKDECNLSMLYLGINDEKEVKQ